MSGRVLFAMCGFLAFSFLAAPPSAQVIDEKPRPPIPISGYLDDEDGKPLEGVFAWQVLLYADETSTKSLGSVTTGTLVCERGVFSIDVQIQHDLELPQPFWFSLAIDTDEDGLDEDDLFGGRFQVGTVPFSFSSQPTAFYTINAGGLSVGSKSFGSDGKLRLHLTPFCSPAGGVLFNRMSVWIIGGATPNPTVSFGIYDAEGKIVATSGPVILGSTGPMIVEAAAVGHLLPSRLYYAAIASNSSDVSVLTSPLQPTPGAGYVQNAVANGVIPSSFDPSKIINPWQCIPMSMTLRRVLELGAASAGSAPQPSKTPRVTFLEFKDTARDKPTTLSLQGIRIMR